MQLRINFIFLFFNCIIYTFVMNSDAIHLIILCVILVLIIIISYFLYKNNLSTNNTSSICNYKNAFKSGIDPVSNSPDINNYYRHNGIIYDINKILGFISKFTDKIDAYGYNSTVNYIGINFRRVSETVEKFRVVTVFPDDYFLIQVKIPKNIKYFKDINLFNITPYIYTYYGEGTESGSPYTKVFASTDNTIQFFDKIKLGKTYNICITSSKKIASYYDSQNYIISKLPVNLLPNATFAMLCRIGFINNKKFHRFKFRNFIKFRYYREKNQNSIYYPPNLYFYSREIFHSIKIPTKLPNTIVYNDGLKLYNDIVDKYAKTHIMLKTVPYLSNIYGATIANVYDALSVSPYGQAQANNTGEAYFNTNFITLSDYPKNAYINIIALNQNKMGVALTSNVQIYKQGSLDLINNGTILTAPDLPSMSSIHYPHRLEIDNIPLINIASYSINSILQQNITEIIVVERLSYNLINFNQPAYSYEGSATVFIGNNIL